MSTPSGPRNTVEDFERYKFARESSIAEVMHRRERQWKVFSWVSSLYLAIIGGVIVISSNELTLAPQYKVLLAVAVVLFFVLGLIRLLHESREALKHWESCRAWDQTYNQDFKILSKKKIPFMSYAHIIFLFFMMGITLVVIWVPATT